MAKKIRVKKEEWKPEGGLESTGEVKKAKIKLAPLSSKTEGKLDSDLKVKKKIYVPREPKKGATEKAFQYYREKEAGSSDYKKLTDELIKNNPEYKDDIKLKKIRKKR